MDDMASEILRKSIERLTAYSVPQRVPTAEGRDERHWIVRVMELPSDMGRVGDELNERAQASVADARRARGLPEAQAHVPAVALSAIEPHHLLVHITTIALEDDDAHEYLVAGSAVLTALNHQLNIEEIQGIPLRYWRLLVGP